MRSWLHDRAVALADGRGEVRLVRDATAAAERFNRLLDAEYAARRFTWHDVVERPVYVATTVARARRHAGADVDFPSIPRQITVPGQPWGWGGCGRSRRP